MSRASVSRFDEFNEIPSLRQLRPDVAAFGNQFVRGAISRADEAFRSFFGRVRDGDAPGYPRFKSEKRFTSVFYDEPVCWKLQLESARPHLYVQGVGQIPLSKKATHQLLRLIDRGGEARTLTVTRTRSGAWRAAVGLRGVGAEPLADNDQAGGVDRGIAVTAALSDGTLLHMPGFLAEAREEIVALSRRRAREKPFGPEWRRLNRRIAKAYAKAAHRSENWARHAAIEIVRRYGVIALEALELRNMTRSAKGTREKPGRNVKAKSGLNRSLQDAALGRLAYWTGVKAEEAGRRVYRVDPRNSSRTCIACGHAEAANRRRSIFCCRHCGHEAHADINAAQVSAARGEAADASWQHMGCPLLERPVSRNRRRAGSARLEPAQLQGAGSAPHARVA
ncbi:MAG: RNA-guided endonuclease InsQ/TnpB family protein [Acidimicrobiales bacterium]